MNRTPSLLLLLLLLLQLGACTNRQPVTVTHGSTSLQIGQKWALGGKTYDRITVDKNGQLSITTRDDLQRSFGDAMLAAASLGGAYFAAAANEAQAAARAAATIGSQKAAVRQAAIKSHEAIELGKQATERFLHPPEVLP